MLLLCLLFLIIAFVAVHWGRESLLKAWFSFPVADHIEEGAKVTLTGQAVKKEQAAEYDIIYLKDTSIVYQEQIVREPNLLVYSKEAAEIRLGNILEVSGELSFFEDRRNPGEFSGKDYYRSRNIAARIWSDEIQVKDPRIFPVRERLSEIKRDWTELLLERAGQKQGGILCAVILGDKGRMDEEIKGLYQVNGIAHVLAISGLHLSFVGMGTYRLLRRITGSYLAAGGAGIFLLLLYILMIGGSISAVRALIMFCIRVGADVWGRAYDAPTSLAVAAVGVILWRPLAFYDAGFQLSFGAVGGIILLYPVLVPKKSDSRIKDSLMASLCIQLAVFPFLLYHYYEFPLYGIFLNLAVIPLMSFLLAFGFAGSLLCLAWKDGGGFLIWLCKKILEIFEILCRGSAALPGSRVITGQPQVLWIAVYFGLLLLAVVWHGMEEGKYGKIFAALGVCILIVSCPAWSFRGLEVTLLDVGQGDGIFLREEGGIVCLIDGGSSDRSKLGRYCLEPFLKARGVSALDYVFVTHGDSDHISGIRELAERQDRGVKISCLVFPDQAVWDEKLWELYELAKEQKISTAVIRAGQQIRGKELTIGCLWPEAGQAPEGGNGASLVLEAHYADAGFLFTGDLEGEGEEYLAGTLKKTYQILKVAHHGSKYSTGDTFLESVSPKLALISAGKDNSYGHPGEETLKRLRKSGAAILRTDRSGAIILKLKGKEVANLKIIQYNRFYEKFE